MKIAGRFAPDHSAALALKDQGNAHLCNGQLEIAAESYRQAIVQNPSYAEAYSNLGFVFGLQSSLDEAIVHYRKAIELKPDLYPAHQNLGVALLKLGQTDAAEKSFRRVIALAPEHSIAFNNLGEIAVQRGDFSNAETLLLRALELQPEYAEAYSTLGIALHMLGRQSEAEAHYRRALELKPDFDTAYCNLGIVLMELGKMGEAEKSLSTALELTPSSIPSLLALLTLVPYQPDDPRFNQLETIYSNRELLSLDDQIKLNFAMGKAMESIAQFDRSFSAYEEGNQLSYQRDYFDDSAEDRALEKLSGIFTSDLFSKCAALEETLPIPEKDRVPIFIVGMPRSGSTLIEQILSSHREVYGAGEIVTFAEFAKKAYSLLDSLDSEAALLALRKLGQEYLDRVWKLAPNACFITDKMLENYQHLGLIYLMIPSAKIIHSMRNPMDTCFSCYAQPFSIGNTYSFDLQTLGRQYFRYSKLMSHWHNVLPSGWILDVSYEANVANLEGQTRRMLDYLGLTWEATCLRFYENKRIVRTASTPQVRKPIYSNSIGRWKHFAKHLTPLFEIIHPTMPVTIEDEIQDQINA
ncbi:sulfotransferase family protein [Solimicrobium silvestre]|nr:sulfotransferase [Solimicrobium silvestre]